MSLCVMMLHVGAARYNTGLLINLTQKSVVFSILFLHVGDPNFESISLRNRLLTIDMQLGSHARNDRVGGALGTGQTEKPSRDSQLRCRGPKET